MLKETTQKIETILKSNKTLDEKQTLELKILLKRLENQIQEASNTKEEQSDSMKDSLSSFKKNVSNFESTHPDVVEIINNISNILSNMGI